MVIVSTQLHFYHLFITLSALPAVPPFSSSLLFWREEATINISGCAAGGPPCSSWRAGLLMEFGEGPQMTNRQREYGSVPGFLQFAPHYRLSMSSRASLPSSLNSDEPEISSTAVRYWVEKSESWRAAARFRLFYLWCIGKHNSLSRYD